MNNATNKKYSISYAEIVPRIFIGDCAAPKNNEFIVANNITYIVCASNDIRDVNPNIATVFIDDLPDIDFVDAGNVPLRAMAKLFSMRTKMCLASDAIANKYKSIVASKSSESILIHCKAGVNRSAMIIGLFLKKHLGMQYEDIIDVLSTANEERNKMMPVLVNQSFRTMLMFE